MASENVGDNLDLESKDFVKGNTDTLNPACDLENSNIMPEDVKEEVDGLSQSFDPIPHEKVLKSLLDQIQRLDFRQIAKLEVKESLQRKHLIVCTIDELGKTAASNNWRLCRNNNQTYVFKVMKKTWE